MTHWKRTAALVLAACLLCGCGREPKYDPAKDENAPVQALAEPGAEDAAPTGELTTTVRMEALTFPEGTPESGWQHFDARTGTLLCEYSDDEHAMHHLVFNQDLTDFTETVFVPLAPHDGFYYMGGVFAYDGDMVYSVATMENHSGMEPYLNNKYEEQADFDWDRWYSTWETEHFLCTYAKDGTLVSSTRLEGMEKYADVQGYYDYSYLFWTESGLYLFFYNGTVLRIGEDGSVTETASASDEPQRSSVSNGFWTPDGRLVFAGAFSEPGTGYLNGDLRVFDPVSGQFGETLYQAQSRTGFGVQFVPGYGEFQYLVDDNGIVSGIRADGTSEALINWKDSDLSQMIFCPLPDGDFLGEYQNGGPAKPCRLVRLHSSEIQVTQELTIAVVDGLYNDEFIREFNRSQKAYRLELVKYADLSEVRNEEEAEDVIAAAREKLKLDLVSGKGPDLILMEDSHSYFDSFGAKGMFCDLTEFLEQDPDWNITNIVPSYLDAVRSRDGKLYAIAPGFVVGTLAVKEKFGVSENWTMQELIALYDAQDDAVSYEWSTRRDMLEMLLAGTDFTDEANGTCSFDSPEFIELLEFCKRFPDKLNVPDKEKDGSEAVDEYYTRSYYRYQRDEDYAFPVSFARMGHSFASTWSYAEADLGGDFTLAGYPSDNGKGAKLALDPEIAITSSCKDKEGAWQAVRAYLRMDGENGEYHGFSILDANFEEQLDDYMYIWDFVQQGGIGRSDNETYNDKGRTVYPLTQEERDRLETYIRSCSTLMTLDDHVSGIVWEEAGMYFSGDRTAEETARMIQSRAQLYLSEQF